MIDVKSSIRYIVIVVLVLWTHSNLIPKRDHYIMPCTHFLSLMGWNESKWNKSTTLTRLQSSTYFTGETVTSYLSVKGFSGEKVWVCAMERWHVLKSKNRASIQKRNKTFSLPFFWGRPTSLIWSVAILNWKENSFCSSFMRLALASTATRLWNVLA